MPRITWLSIIQQDLRSHNLTPPEAVDPEPVSVEDVVDVWRYAILSCMPETMTTTTPRTSAMFKNRTSEQKLFRVTYNCKVSVGKLWRNVFPDRCHREVTVPRGSGIRLRPVLVTFDPTSFRLGRQHHDQRRPLFPDHEPEVGRRHRQRPLSRDVAVHDTGSCNFHLQFIKATLIKFRRFHFCLSGRSFWHTSQATSASENLLESCLFQTGCLSCPETPSSLSLSSRWAWVSRYQNVSILDFIGAKYDGVIRSAKLQPNHHHQQTNTQFFYRPDGLPVAQPTVSKH